MLKKLIHSFIPPSVLIGIMWLIKFYEVNAGIDLGVHGVLPRHIEGLQGILFSPFLHGSWDHLMSNTAPMFFLLGALIFFYEHIWIKAFLIIYFLSGIGLWIGGRESYHIGASGVVYGLTGFLFLSGVLKRDIKLMAVSMLVIFLYGGMIWGIFPMLVQVSWEAHLFGLLSGCLVALIFRDSGPKKILYQWEKDEVDELLNSDSGSSSESESGSESGSSSGNISPSINYIYTEKKKPNEQ